MTETLTAARNVLGSYIRKKRVALGLNQEELAERTGVGQETISHIETGRTGDPRLTTLRKIARGLEIDPNILVRISEGWNPTRPATLEEAAEAYRRSHTIRTTAAEIEELLAQVSPETAENLLAVLRDSVKQAARIEELRAASRRRSSARPEGHEASAVGA